MTRFLLIIMGTFVLGACSGADGLDSLIRVEVIGDGSDCRGSGIRLHSGLDLDRDGILGDDEVGVTDVLCHGIDGNPGDDGLDGPGGTDGLGALVRLDPEPAGERCALGGVAVHSGIDADGDEQLSDEEATSTEYVCEGAPALAELQGSFTIRNNLDLLFARQFETVTGDLSIDAPGLNTVALPHLRHVHGDFFIQGDVDSLSLPLLTDLGGSLVVNARLFNVTMPPLGTIPGDLTLSQVASAELLAALSSVTEIGGDVSISGTQLTELAMPLLTRIEGGLSLLGNAGLTDLSGLTGLTHLGGQLVIQGNEGLTSLAGLSGVQGLTNFIVVGNTALPTCDVDALLDLLIAGGFETDGTNFISGNDDEGTCE